MAVTQILNALGTFEFELNGNVPREIMDSIQYFGHVAIIPGRMDPRQYGDGCLTAARYVGVVRKKKMADDGRTNLVEDDIRIGGVGMEFWLGDDDGKGAVIENLTSFASAGFATVMGASPTGLRPTSVGAGTLYSVSGSYSGRHQYETPRSAIKYVCDTMSTAAIPLGYRVNNNATLDAGPESNLYVTNPVCAIVFKGVTQGEDMFLRALPSTADYDEDMEDFATRVVMLAESDAQNLATGSADISVISPGTNVYKDLFGNTLALTKLVSESDTTVPLADTRAALALRAVIDKNRSLTLSAEDYDFHGTFQPGDYVWVYDPDRNLYDTANEVTIRGVRINPIKLQVTEADWSICEGHTIAYRDSVGVWTDLTDYVRWDEQTPVKVVVGDFARTLSSTGQDVGARLSALIPADLLFPAAPTWNTPFTGASYNDSNGYPKARVLLSWNTPANTDSSTITDGQYYEVQLRLQGQTQWDIRFVTWGQNQLLLQDLAVGTGYEVRIRGVDTGGNAGAFSSTSQFTTSTDATPPSTPAAPTIAASTLAVQMTHTLGKSSGGTYNLESDLAYLELHGSVSNGFTAASGTLLGTVAANQGMMTATTPVVATFDISSTALNYYVVKAVDNSGNKSAQSSQASATATLVDTAHISDLTVSKVTAGTISADWLLSSNIQTAATGARVALTNTGLQGYDSAGNNTVTITNDGTFSAVSSPSLATTPVIEYAGTSAVWNTSTSGTACQINRPEGIQVGDLMLAFLETNSDTTATITMTGWTSVGTVTRGNHSTANQDTNLIVLKRNYVLDDPSYWSGQTSTATRMQSVTVAYRGADTAGNQFLSNLSVSGASGAPATTKIAGPITNSTTSAWRVVAFAGLDTTSGGTWDIASSVGTDVERNDSEAGSANPFMTIAVYDSNGTVTNTSQSSTGTFANGYVSVVSWMGYLVPLPQSSSASRIEIDSQGIRTYNQVNTKTLDIVGGTGSIDLQGSVSSFNYLEGIDGWKINSNGAAQFENLNVINTVGADNGNFDVGLQLGGVDVATEDFYKVKSPTVFVGKEAAQGVVISNSGGTLITFDTKYHERNIVENSMQNLSSNPSRIKAPVDGIYNVSYNMTTYWNTSPLPTANNAHAITIRKNAAGSFTGGSKITSCYGWISNANANYVTCPGSFDIALAAGDYLEWFSHTNASGYSAPTTRSTVGEVPACTYVSMRYVSSVDGIGVGGTTVGNATFFATACRTFQGSNTERPPNIADYAYQGYYDSNYGNQKSMILFDDAAIKTALTGKTVTSCKLYYHVFHSYYSTMDVSVGTHNNTTETVWPGSGGVSANLKLFTNQAAGSSYTQELGTTIGANFQTGGTARGIVFGPGPSTVHNYYGYLAGWVPGNSNGFNPRLVFTYV